MSNSIGKSIAAALASGTAVACAQAPTAVVAPGALALKPGIETQVAGTMFSLVFLKVEADSRCPSNVQCASAGNGAAQVGLRLGMGPTTPFVINTANAPTHVTAHGFDVRLDSLKPYPRNGTEIKPGDYVAYVTVSAKAP